LDPPDFVRMGPPDFGVWTHPISSQSDHRPEPLFRALTAVFCASLGSPGAGTAMHTYTDHFPGNPGLDRRTHLASKNRFARAFCFLSSKCGHAAHSHLNPVPSWYITNGRAGWREGSLIKRRLADGRSLRDRAVDRTESIVCQTPRRLRLVKASASPCALPLC
jgi:hypothetical protein